MNEPTEVPLKCCPGCQDEVQPEWAVCPFCGLRLKPADDLLARSVAWLAVLGGFVLGELAIYKHDPNAAAAYGTLLGLPLAYVFGKAVLFRWQGQPLTWRQLSRTTVRATLTTFVLLVVIPVAIGIAFLLLAFAICAGIYSAGR